VECKFTDLVKLYLFVFSQKNGDLIAFIVKLESM
jgi:hypothetical protein